MSVQILLQTGENVHFDDKLVGEGATLDRDDHWFTVTDGGVLKIHVRHLDGSTWESTSDFAETNSTTMTFSPSGWVSVAGDRAHPDHRR